MDEHSLLHSLVMWAAFVAGQLGYMLKRSAMAVSAKQNPATSTGDFFRRNWDVLMVRAFYGAAIFWAWEGDLLAQFGLEFSTGIPHHPALAFFSGLGSDVVLDGAQKKKPGWFKLPGFRGPGADDTDGKGSE